MSAFGIKIKNEFLDLPENFVVEFELKSMLFSSIDNDILPGSFQIPVTVPLSRKNKKLLNYPHLINNADKLLEDEPAEIWAGGSLVWSGTLTVSSANEFSARIYTVINPISSFKDVSLRDLVDEERTGINPAHAKLTAQNPLNYDYIFFPVINQDFLIDRPYRVNFENSYQNWWDSTGQAFGESEDYPAAMPFIRVDYLLEKVFAQTDFVFSNRWQINDTRRKIVLYNNYSIYTDTNADEVPDAWAGTINLKNHVPDIKAADFVKAWMRIFALGLFVDFNDLTIELVPIDTLLKLPPRHDWSDSLLRGKNIEQNKTSTPDAIRFEEPDDDYQTIVEEHFTQFFDDVITVDDFPDMNAQIGNPGTGIFYIRSKGQFFSFTLSGITSSLRLVHCDTGVMPEYNQTYEFESYPSPLLDYYFGNDSYTPLNNPYVDFPTTPYKVTPAVGYTGTILGVDGQDEEVPFRWMVYRGMIQDQNGDSYPSAALANTITDEHFIYQGDFGIYENYWRTWHDMLRNGKQITATLNLSLEQFLTFNLKDKVTIGSMDYFVKSMKVRFSRRGLMPLEVELVSVL